MRIPDDHGTIISLGRTNVLSFGASVKEWQCIWILEFITKVKDSHCLCVLSPTVFAPFVAFLLNPKSGGKVLEREMKEDHRVILGAAISGVRMSLMVEYEFLHDPKYQHTDYESRYHGYVLRDSYWQDLREERDILIIQIIQN